MSKQTTYIELIRSANVLLVIELQYNDYTRRMIDHFLLAVEKTNDIFQTNDALQILRNG